MILTVILLPLISFLLVAFLARFIGRQGSVLITIIIMFVNIILTVIMSYNINFHQKWLFIKAGTWMYSDILQIDWGFYIDNLTLTMLLVVNIISGLVHLYSADYMAHDPHLPRFMSYLSLFTFFMLVLVTGDNLVVLFVGWEGVGLCSYLLINFWYTRIQANKAAIKALIVNRIADFALILGLAAIFFVFKSLDVHIIFSLVPFFLNSSINFLNFNFPVLNVICSLLFIGAMGKSAQIGLHTWLPDAMEGPTPVSALIHAATMVTAGVFLIIKCSPLFEYVPTILSLVTFIGATTAFFSATIGLVQNDIKKVIAYSTCSQLGYMVFACGLSMYNVSLFHLANHAFFKALLFLSAGAIIHSVSNEQDMRKFGALASILPFTTIMFLIGSLSLTGFPFLTGFYSKDLILELALTKYTIEGSFAYTLGLVTAFFTSFYSFRVFYLTFVYKTNGFRHTIALAHELPWKMAISLSILSLGSIFVGYLTKDLFVGLGTDFWNNSILILPEHNNQLAAEFFGLPGLHIEDVKYFWNSTYSSRWVKLLPFFFSLLALFLVYIFYSHIPSNSIKKSSAAPFLGEPFFFSFDLETKDRILIATINFPMDGVFSVDLTFPEFEDLINLYTPTGFSKVYEETAIFSLPYEVDDPLTPSYEIINNKKYYLYQKLLWDLEQGQIGLLEMPLEVFDDLDEYYLIYRALGTRPEMNKNPIKEKMREIYFFLTHKWYFDEIYNEYINRPLLIVAYDVIFRFLDKGILEIFGPYGISSTLFWAAKKIKKFHSGRVYYYAYFMFLMLLILLNIQIIFFRS